MFLETLVNEIRTEIFENSDIGLNGGLTNNTADAVWWCGVVAVCGLRKLLKKLCQSISDEEGRV